MSEAKEELQLRRIAKGKKPQYANDPATDNLLSMVLVLMQELSVAIDRIDTIEQVLSEEQLVEIDQLASYEPSEPVAADRAAQRAAMIRRIFRSSESEFQSMTNFPRA
jgi:hypothetical protein